MPDNERLERLGQCIGNELFRLSDEELRVICDEIECPVDDDKKTMVENIVNSLRHYRSELSYHAGGVKMELTLLKSDPS